MTGGKETIRQAVLRGLEAEHLNGDGRKIFEFVVKFVEEYNEVPSRDFIHSRLDVELPIPEVPWEFCLQDIHQRFRVTTLDTMSSTVINHLTNEKIDEAEKEVSLAAEKLSHASISGSQTQTIGELAEQVKRSYEEIEGGKRGILTPWPTINYGTLGFWPEDLVLFAARVGTGKTWLAIILAVHAWQVQKKRVLFLTTEVSKIRIANRLFAYLAKLNYGGVSHGSLSKDQKDLYFKTIDSVDNGDAFHIVGGNFDYKFESIAKEIDRFKPDILYIDGVYLLKVQGNNRTERMANVFDEVKRLAKNKKLPIVTTTQFNREVKANAAATVGVESIAMSDVGAWNADIVYGMVRTDEMIESKQLELKCLKMREGRGQDLMCKWDFINMDFYELISDQPGNGDASMQGTKAGDDPDFRPEPPKDLVDDDIPF